MGRRRTRPRAGAARLRDQSRSEPRGVRRQEEPVLGVRRVSPSGADRSVPCTRSWSTSSTSTSCTRRSSSMAIAHPIAAAAYWFNQNVIDGVVNGAGRRGKRTGDWVYRNIDQRVVDGAVNASGLAASEGGHALQPIQSGKVNQYGALALRRRRGRRHRPDPDERLRHMTDHHASPLPARRVPDRPLSVAQRPRRSSEGQGNHGSSQQRQLAPHGRHVPPTRGRAVHDVHPRRRGAAPQADRDRDRRASRWPSASTP